MTLSGDDGPRDRDFGYASTTCRDVPGSSAESASRIPTTRVGKMALETICTLGEKGVSVWVSFLLANNGS